MTFKHLLHQNIQMDIDNWRTISFFLPVNLETKSSFGFFAAKKHKKMIPDRIRLPLR